MTSKAARRGSEGVARAGQRGGRLTEARPTWESHGTLVPHRNRTCGGRHRKRGGRNWVRGGRNRARRPASGAAWPESGTRRPKLGAQRPKSVAWWPKSSAWWPEVSSGRPAPRPPVCIGGQLEKFRPIWDGAAGTPHRAKKEPPPKPLWGERLEMLLNTKYDPNSVENAFTEIKFHLIALMNQITVLHRMPTDGIPIPISLLSPL
jgi:hypothetical protein